MNYSIRPHGDAIHIHVETAAEVWPDDERTAQWNRLKAAWSSLLKQGRTGFVLDLERVDVIGAYGLSVLTDMARCIRQRDGNLQTVNYNACVQRALRLTRLEALLGTETNEA